MRDRIALALIFLWTVLLVAAADARAEKRVALVIGNGAYRDVSFLKKPPNDARKVAAILKDMGFDVTLSIDADKQELERLAADFKAALPSADVGFFFFSGHGFQTANVSQQHPINHIVPIDFDVEKATSELGTVSLDVIVEALRSNARLEAARGIEIAARQWTCRASHRLFDRPGQRRFRRPDGRSQPLHECTGQALDDAWAEHRRDSGARLGRRGARNGRSADTMECRLADGRRLQVPGCTAGSSAISSQASFLFWQ